MTDDRPEHDPVDGSAVDPEGPEGVAGEQDEPARLSRRQMFDQLEVMARQIAADTPPVLKQSTATLAEWTAMAARSTGPLARRLAEIAGDASLRIAERSQRLAEDLRAEAAAEGAGQEAAETDQGTSHEEHRTPPSDRD